MNNKKLLERLEATARDLTTAEIDVADVPDFAGRVRAVERLLGEARRRWQDDAVEAAKDPEHEAGPDTFPEPAAEYGQWGGVSVPRVKGREYRTETYSEVKRRTFNRSRILIGLIDCPGLPDVTDIGAALDFVTAHNVARLEWLWQPREGGGLKRLAAQVGLPMVIVAGEIGDDASDDAPWVGEVREEKTRTVPINDDGDKIE